MEMKKSRIGENITGIGGTKRMNFVAGVIPKPISKSTQKGVAGVIAKVPVKSAQKGVVRVIAKPINVRNGSGLLSARKTAMASR